MQRIYAYETYAACTATESLVSQCRLLDKFHSPRPSYTQTYSVRVRLLLTFTASATRCTLTQSYSCSQRRPRCGWQWTCPGHGNGEPCLRDLQNTFTAYCLHRFQISSMSDDLKSQYSVHSDYVYWVHFIQVYLVCFTHHSTLLHRIQTDDYQTEQCNVIRSQYSVHHSHNVCHVCYIQVYLVCYKSSQHVTIQATDDYQPLQCHVIWNHNTLYTTHAVYHVHYIWDLPIYYNHHSTCYRSLPIWTMSCDLKPQYSVHHSQNVCHVACALHTSLPGLLQIQSSQHMLQATDDYIPTFTMSCHDPKWQYSAHRSHHMHYIQDYLIYYNHHSASFRLHMATNVNSVMWSKITILCSFSDPEPSTLHCKLAGVYQINIYTVPHCLHAAPSATSMHVLCNAV